MTDAHDAARLLGRILTAGNRLAPGQGPAGSRRPAGFGAAVRCRALDPLLRSLAQRLARSATAEHHTLAVALSAAVESGDSAAARSLVTTAGRIADLHSEKVISRRYRFLCICTPKVASRSIIAGLRAADPRAELVRDRTLDAILERRPETRGYFRFAFMRHPVDRTRSCFADKHTLALRNRNAHRWFIEPYHGLATGMSFSEFCRWLNTPSGSDAFADRHWLSQHRQIVTADGHLPDYIGRWETLESDWRALAVRLGFPCRQLPRLNARPPGPAVDVRPDADTMDSLQRRYAEDFRLGGYRLE